MRILTHPQQTHRRVGSLQLGTQPAKAGQGGVAKAEGGVATPLRGGPKDKATLQKGSDFTKGAALQTPERSRGGPARAPKVQFTRQSS